MTKSAALVGLVNAALALAYAFGWDVSAEQQVAIVAAVNALLVVVAAWRDPAVPFGSGQG
jgi:uncharacterized membrane protein